MRFEVYVCTAAQRDYALEAWRNLDPRAALIRQDQYLTRIINVPHPGTKYLDQVLRLRPVPEGAEGNAVHQPRAPLAVIVDDKPEVGSSNACMWDLVKLIRKPGQKPSGALWMLRSAG